MHVHLGVAGEVVLQLFLLVNNFIPKGLHIVHGGVLVAH